MKIVLINTVRGGKDPDDFWHVVTEELGDILEEPGDVWRTLGDYETAKDPRILAAYVTEAVARAIPGEVAYEIEAEGY